MKFTPPYLGSAYYPECWPPEQVDQDIDLMLEAGMNMARIAEFAWSAMEPHEGQVQLEWLQRVVEKLGAAGIATVMCTPSCTPPAWLTEKYPEVRLVDYQGRPLQHGFRRHVCPTSPVYRDHCGRIAEILGKAFGQDDNVVGWQIDNEVYLWHDWGCYCPNCIKAFHTMLEQKFGSIEALNATWGTNIWSQTYQSFSQIPAPWPDMVHHPSLLQAWILFQGEAVVDYVLHQADVLHKYVKQPVGTDMMPVLGINYETIHRRLDVVQYNHYDTTQNLWKQTFWMDYVRPFKDVPWWNTETSTCWNGGVKSNGYRDPGFCLANSWLPIALGGEANLYWLWRSHWSGQEVQHGSVVSSSGRPLHIMGEVQEIARGYKASETFLNGTRLAPPRLGVHMSTQAWATMRFQPIIHDFNYVDVMSSQVYRPLMDAHLRADIIDPSAALDDYRLIFSPFLPAIDEGGLAGRLRAWIEAGGTWVVGPLSDTRDLEGAKPKHAPFKYLEDWAGVYCKYEVPGDPHPFVLQWADGHTSHASIWCAGFELKNATALANYTERPFEGLAAITETSIGQGRIVILGTLPQPADLQRLMLSLAAQAGIHPAAEATPNVLVAPRSGEAGRGCVVVEIENRAGTLTVPEPATDLLTGNMVSGVVDVQPYQVMVLSYTAR